jgi:hypothetical protein
VHVDGEIQRAVVRVGAEIDQRLRQIESVVDDGDDRRGDAVAVGQLRIGAALDQRLGDVFVPLRTANINAVNPPVG